MRFREDPEVYRAEKARMTISFLPAISFRLRSSSTPFGSMCETHQPLQDVPRVSVVRKGD